MADMATSLAMKKAAQELGLTISTAAMEPLTLAELKDWVDGAPSPSGERIVLTLGMFLLGNEEEPPFEPQPAAPNVFPFRTLAQLQPQPMRA